MKKILRRCVVTLMLYIISNNLFAQAWPAGIHDPSNIVRHKDRYWFFGTGDGIAARYSYDLVTWYYENENTPFTDGYYPAWIDQYTNDKDPNHPSGFNGSFWAPDIIYMNNKYYLYYSASMWGTAYSCIGLVINETLDPTDPNYEWVDQGDIGLYSPKSGWSINAIDPALMRGPDGKIWMTWGSFNRDGIMVTEIDSVSGKSIGTNISVANSWTGGTAYGEGEGAAMVYHDGYYYMFYDKGGCCAGINSSYYMVVGCSTSPQGPFIDKAGNPMRVVGATSGGTVIFRHDDSRGSDDRYYGPGHLGYFKEGGREYVTFHYYNPNGFYRYDGPDDPDNILGHPTLGMGFLKWGKDGWPSISFDYLEEGFYTIMNVNSGKALDLQDKSLDVGTSIYQYDQDENSETQRWFFKPLGTGEYTIQSYADTSKYLEATGPSYHDRVRIAENYTGAVNQKFRLVKGVDDKVIIYSSKFDEILEIPSASLSDTYVHLWPNTNHDCQRWYAQPFEGTLSVESDTIRLSPGDTTITIQVQSNTTWTVSVQDASWAELIYVDGDGNGAVFLDILENMAPEARSNKITFKGYTGQLLEVTLEQQHVDLQETELNIKSKDGLGIYPNPAVDNLFVDIPQLTGKEVIRIIDLTGTERKQVVVNSKKIQLDIESLASGMYILKLQGQDYEKSRLFIKK